MCMMLLQSWCGKVLNIPFVYVCLGHRQKEYFYAHAHRCVAETGLAVRVLLIDN